MGLNTRLKEIWAKLHGANVTIRSGARQYWLHFYGPGNAIAWSEYRIGYAHGEVDGHKRIRPQKGDVLCAKLKRISGMRYGVFVFTDVKHYQDPADYFWGQVAFVGYMDELQDKLPWLYDYPKERVSIL